MTRGVSTARVFPTGVGVYRVMMTLWSACVCFPHRRGGVPVFMTRGVSTARVFPTGVGVYRATVNITTLPLMFSPQAWGCTAAQHASAAGQAVFPTGVGVYPSKPSAENFAEVFPTGVGVYRHDHLISSALCGFPHRRGGVPFLAGGDRLAGVFSPQAWGCTGNAGNGGALMTVFPTGVGVYRAFVSNARVPRSFPHRRGGVPVPEVTSMIFLCVFPTGVGVYRSLYATGSFGAGFPHRRGGVPTTWRK